MPIDFDDNDLQEVIDQTEQALPDLPSEADVDQQMSEVEARLEMAQYYRLLLNDSIFQDPPNPDVAQCVEDEVRGFIRTRMGVLMGVGLPETKKSAFALTDGEMKALRELATPEIVHTLKALVSKLLKKPSIMEARPAPRSSEEPKLQPKVVTTPTLRKVMPKVRTVSAPREVDRKPEARVAPPRVAGRRGQQKRIVQTVTKEDGTVFEQDITPPAKPVGQIQPIPTPNTRGAIESQMAMASAAHDQAAQRMLNRKLTTRQGDD